MSDELHKYPGNLKHHKVKKEKQRKLLSDMMQDDAKSGLYDAPARRGPLLSNEDMAVIHYDADGIWDAIDITASKYETARAKDAELIQRLVDALWDLYRHTDIEGALRTIELASRIGFKPSER